MKQLLLIAFIFIGFTASAQYIQNSSAYSYKGVLTINSLQPPQGCGLPVTNINAPDSSQFAIYWDSCGEQMYVFSPKSQTWSILQSAGSSGVITFNNRDGDVVSEEGDYTLDQLGDVHITDPQEGQYLKREGGGWVNASFDTLVVLDSCYNGGSLFRNDTIFVCGGTVDTTYFPTDSLSYVDSTGQPQWRLLNSLPGKKIGSSSRIIVDTAAPKIVIGSQNISWGGSVGLGVVGALRLGSHLYMNNLYTGAATDSVVTWDPVTKRMRARDASLFMQGGGASAVYAGSYLSNVNDSTLRLSADSARTKHLMASNSLTVGDSALFYAATKYAVFVGDSWVVGNAANPTGLRWTSLVASMMGVLPLNYGIAGTTMSQESVGDSAGINRLWTTTYNAAYQALFIAYGINDARHGINDTTQFKTDYTTYINTAISNGWPLSKIYIVGNGFWLIGSPEKAPIYSGVLQRLAATLGVNFVDTYSEMIKSGTGDALMYSDGFHPNNRGHQIIAKTAINSYKSNNNQAGSIATIRGIAYGNNLVLNQVRNNTITPVITTIQDSGVGTGDLTRHYAYTGASNSYNFFRAGGSYNYPTTVANNDDIGRLNFSAYDGIGYNTIGGLRFYATATGASTSSMDLIIGSNRKWIFNSDGSLQISSNGNISASGGTAYAVHDQRSLTATANSDNLVAWRINPNYNAGSFTGVVNTAIQAKGNIDPLADATYSLGKAGSSWSSIRVASVTSSSALTLTANSASNITLVSNSTNRMRMFGSTGNTVFQNGGTFADAGYLVDVRGTLRATGDVTLTSLSTGTSADSVLVVNSAVVKKIPQSLLLPAGNYGNLQINRNGFLATPASDSLSFTSGELKTYKYAVLDDAVLPQFHGLSFTTGLSFRNTGTTLTWRHNGTPVAELNNTGVVVNSSSGYGFSSGNPVVNLTDVQIMRKSAGTIAVSGDPTGGVDNGIGVLVAGRIGVGVTGVNGGYMFNTTSGSVVPAYEGSVSVTSGSDIVTANTPTYFTNSFRVGDTIAVAGMPNKAVIAITDNEHLQVHSNYSSSTVGGVAYYNSTTFGTSLFNIKQNGSIQYGLPPTGTAGTDSLLVWESSSKAIKKIPPAGATYTNSATLDFGSTSAQSSADLTITVTGATAGAPVMLGVPNGSVLSNSSFSAWVSATNTVTVRFNNYSSGSQDPASGTFTVRVIQ